MSPEIDSYGLVKRAARSSGVPITSTANPLPVCESRFTRLRERMSSAMGPLRDGDTLRAALEATRQDLLSLRPGEIVLRQRLRLASPMLND